MLKDRNWAKFELGYVTIELTSAFLVADSDGDQLFDDVFVKDANGLPCIPGESLAGILRHAIAGLEDPETDDTCRNVFGYQDKGEGDASRVRISYAHAHDQHDRPVPFRGAETNDPVLAALQAGVGRDHVRIGMTGAVDDRGKFDVRLVPAGSRFTFELAVSANSRLKLKDLVGELTHPGLRIGGKTRRGLGSFKIVRVKSAAFDLSNKDDVKRLAQLPVALEKAVSSKVLGELKDWSRPQRGQWLQGKLTLTPIGTWMIGGGIPTGNEPPKEGDKPWDDVPLSERRIQWSAQGQGRVESDKESQFLVPGSSVKGSLRHRTAFHIRRLRGEWLEANREYPVTEEEAFLFGDIRSKDGGVPGRVFISDLYLKQRPSYEALQHVSLDRFTQGPMDHLLFDELALGKASLELEVAIQQSEDWDTNPVAQRAREALALALEDLRIGRLSLGAGRGHGRFKGDNIQWEQNQSLVQKEVAGGRK